MPSQTFDSYLLRGHFFPPVDLHFQTVQVEQTTIGERWFCVDARIEGNQVCVICEISEPVSPADARNSVQAALTRLSGWGFANAATFHIVIERYDVGGSEEPFVPVFPGIPTASFEDILESIMASNEISLAVQDFCAAVREPTETAKHCYRGIETIRSLFGDGKKRSSVWDAMHTALNTSAAFLNPLTDKAKPVRHGQTGDPFLPDHPNLRPNQMISESERRAALLTLREVFLRASAYVKNGKQPLEKRKFPVLTTPTPDWSRHLR